MKGVYLEIFLIYSSGSQLVWRSKVINLKTILLESIMRSISAKLFCICTSAEFRLSFQLVEILTLQVSLAEIYSFIMILNSNMIFWTPESVLCPVLAFKNMISDTPASVHDPAFVRRTDKGRIKPLLYKHLQEKIKNLISKTGRDPQLYSSHSFRRGGCTWAFKAGVPTDLIQHHGDWLSDCYKRYLAFDFKEKLSVSEAMARKIIFLD